MFRKKKNPMDQKYVFHIDWDKIQNFDDLKYLLSNTDIGTFFATPRDLKETGLIKYVKR